jgi:DnaJ domain
MDCNTACEILQLEWDKELEVEQVIKQYRKLSLKYHPDKNNSPDATEQFRKLYDAKVYLETLLEEEGFEDEYGDDDKYPDLKSFVASWSTKNTFVNILYKILETELGQKIQNHISMICERHILYYAQSWDIKLVKKMYVIVLMYRDKWNVSDSFVEELHRIIEERDLSITDVL